MRDMKKCKNYYRYKGLRAPRCGCEGCEAIYAVRSLMEEATDKLIASLRKGTLPSHGGMVWKRVDAFGLELSVGSAILTEGGRR